MVALNESTATELARLIAARKASAVEIVQACLRRIEARDADVQAWETVARSARAASARSVLHADAPPGRRWAVADKSLAECAEGQPFHVARVTDQSPEFLRSLSQAGLEIGAQGVLVSNQSSSADLTIQLAGENRTLSREVAGKLLVR